MSNSLSEAAELAFFVGARVREVRKILGLSQRKFAETLGFSRGYISDIENRNKKPNVELLLSLLDKYHEIRPEWLLTGAYPITKKEEREDVAPKTDIDKEAIIMALEQVSLIADSLETPPSIEKQGALLALLYNAYMYNYHRYLKVETDEWGSAEEGEKGAREMAAHFCSRLANDFDSKLLDTAIGFSSTPVE